MRLLSAIGVVLVMVVALPAATFAAKPVGTTTIEQAGAFFTSDVPGSSTCETEHLIITLGQDAYRSTGPDGKPPVMSGWLDIQVWRETGCGIPELVDGSYIQQTISGLDPATYAIDPLSAAFVDVVFPIYQDDVVVRTLDLDLAWVATGDTAAAHDRSTGTMSQRERDAHLAGTIIDSDGFITIGSLDYATMSTAHYVFRD